MKTIIIFCALLIILPLAGFFLQWIKWDLIPTIQMKRQEKKLKKNKKSCEKRLTNSFEYDII
jgi:hypothetical protein